MKLQKGQPGYIKARKRKYFLIALIEFAIVAALLILGYTQTGTKNNLLTVVAIVGCLPACKMLVGFVVMLPFQSIDCKKHSEIEKKAHLLTRTYEMVLTCKQKLTLIDSVVILDNTVCGYTSSANTDLDAATEYIKEILRENQLEKITVKIFHDYTAFLSRAEGMNNIAMVNRPVKAEKEEQIKHIILNISM